MKNSDHFDEIFAQRGEQVQPENMAVGGYYLNLDTRYPDKTNLFICTLEPTDEKMFEQELLFQDGDFRDQPVTPAHCRGFTYDPDKDVFFKATPDQIELLNSYRV